MDVPQTVTVTPEGCWLMPGGPASGTEYHRVSMADTRSLAHLVMYRALVGPVPRGLQLHHTCEHPPCCNPDHLEPLSPAEHKARHQQARTTCSQGHPVAEHGFRDKGDVLRCKVCRADSVRRHKAKARAEARFGCPCGWSGLGADVVENCCPSCGKRSGRWGPQRL